MRESWSVWIICAGRYAKPCILAWATSNMMTEGKKHKWRTVSGEINRRHGALFHSAEGSERSGDWTQEKEAALCGDFLRTNQWLCPLAGQTNDCVHWLQQWVPTWCSMGLGVTGHISVDIIIKCLGPNHVQLHHKPRYTKKRHVWSECQLLSCVRLFVTPWTVTHQAPKSLEFSRQEYWSG